jgi:hypothetical protein
MRLIDVIRYVQHALTECVDTRQRSYNKLCVTFT